MLASALAYYGGMLHRLIPALVGGIVLGFICLGGAANTRHPALCESFGATLVILGMLAMALALGS